MILLPAALLSLLSQLTSSSGAPHTALVASLPSGAVLSLHSVSTVAPFPRASFQGERDDEERAGLYAALATATWAEHEPARQHAHADGNDDLAKRSEPLMLETELGRISVVAIGAFLLVLVGTQVTPWKVLDTKTRAARDHLLQPLLRIST
ncbi:hypothetical protein JCM10212_006064 [Sporobolomyces blumeae]